MSCCLGSTLTTPLNDDCKRTPGLGNQTPPAPHSIMRNWRPAGATLTKATWVMKQTPPVIKQQQEARGLMGPGAESRWVICCSAGRWPGGQVTGWSGDREQSIKSGGIPREFGSFLPCTQILLDCVNSQRHQEMRLPGRLKEAPSIACEGGVNNKSKTFKRKHKSSSKGK